MFIYLCIGAIYTVSLYLLAQYGEKDLKPGIRYWLTSILFWPIIIMIMVYHGAREASQGEENDKNE